MAEPTKRLYLDLDGVMADFDAHFPATFDLDHRSMADDAMWERINAHPSYFRDMPPCPGAIEFFRSIEHLRPIILTACPKSNYPHVAAQKRAWVREHLSKHVTVLPVLGGRHKPLFMQGPGDVLIDDWDKNAVAWTAAGGIAILHRSFEETRSALAGHFPVGSTRYDDLPPGCAPSGSLHAYERAYSARYKPGEERAHLHGHLAGLRAVVLLDRQGRADSDERTAGVLWSAWSEDDCDSDPRIDPMAQKVTEWFVGRWPVGADEPECRILIGAGRSAEIIARRIAEKLTSILNTDAIAARKSASPAQPAGVLTDEMLHAAMDAFYPGEDWRNDLGCALETSLRDMRAALIAAGIASHPAGQSAGSGAEDWSPIETAPRDGTYFDAWAVHPETGAMGVRFSDVQMRGDGSGFGIVIHRPRAHWEYLEQEGPTFPAWKLTHWRPRPAGPGTSAPDSIRTGDEGVEALEALRGIADDYMTSESHHPGYVLIPAKKFDQLRAAAVALPPKAQGISQAARDVLAERRRQVEVEGWTPEHDDEHRGGEMACAAACYATEWDLWTGHERKDRRGAPTLIGARRVWPWSRWWKPTDRRRNLVKAGALILAEIERLDRATHPAGQSARSGSGWAEVVKAICSAVCRVEGLDPDELQQEYESEAHGWRDTDPQWTRYATAVAEVLDALPLPAPDSTRTGQREATVTVPAKATQEMWAAFRNADKGSITFHDAYRAMVAARPAAPEAQGAEREGFNAGYAMACANIVNLQGEDTIAENVLAESGITLAEVKALGLTDYDMKPLRALFREIARKRNARKSRPAPPASSGQGGR